MVCSLNWICLVQRRWREALGVSRKEDLVSHSPQEAEEVAEVEEPGEVEWITGQRPEMALTKIHTSLALSEFHFLN